MKSIILSIISLLICVNCYAAPGILRHPGGDFDVVVYLGHAIDKSDNAYIYTTQRSIDILLNNTYYNEKDWGLYLLIEPIGNSRKNAVEGLSNDKSVSWFNTASGSRTLWAVQIPVQTNNNIMTYHGQRDYYNDYGELLGARNYNSAENVDLSEDAFSKAIDSVVLNYLNREFARRKNMDTGRPIQ